MQKITVEVVSDVVCPWCYIGKRRLEKAIEELKGEYEFDVSYLPFELNPNMPKEGRNQKEYLIEKFGGEDRYNQLTNNVAAVAAEEGLHLTTVNKNILPTHEMPIVLFGWPNRREYKLK